MFSRVFRVWSPEVALVGWVCMACFYVHVYITVSYLYPLFSIFRLVRHSMSLFLSCFDHYNTLPPFCTSSDFVRMSFTQPDVLVLCRIMAARNTRSGSSNNGNSNNNDNPNNNAAGIADLLTQIIIHLDARRTNNGEGT